MERSDGVECYIQHMLAWFSINLVMLVLLEIEHIPDLEDDLQGFPNEGNRKSAILDMVGAIRSFEIIEKSNIREWLQSVACQVGFQLTRNCQRCCETEERSTGWRE
jgi:hypothetical protein